MNVGDQFFPDNYNYELFHAWREGRIEGHQYALGVVVFKSDIEDYVCRPEDNIEKLHVARWTFSYEPEPEWPELKKRAIELFGLNLKGGRICLSDSTWRRLRKAMGRSGHPGRPKKSVI